MFFHFPIPYRSKLSLINNITLIFGCVGLLMILIVPLEFLLHLGVSVFGAIIGGLAYCAIAYFFYRLDVSAHFDGVRRETAMEFSHYRFKLVSAVQIQQDGRDFWRIGLLYNGFHDVLIPTECVEFEHDTARMVSFPQPIVILSDDEAVVEVTVGLWATIFCPNVNNPNALSEHPVDLSAWARPSN